MLKVRVLRKHRDPKTGLLVGYTICEEGKPEATMPVHKDVLKDKVRSGQCEVVNMTLTSDGRFIGKAGLPPKPREPRTSGIKVVQVYTLGKDILCAMLNTEEYIARTGKAQVELKGMKPGTEFEFGQIAVQRIASRQYDGIVMGEDGKPDLKASSISKNSFSKLRPRLLKIITENGVESKISVKKVSKDVFGIYIDNYETLMGAGLHQVVKMYKCLIIYAVKNGTKFRIKNVGDNVVEITGPDNVTDAKKVIKLVTETK